MITHKPLTQDLKSDLKVFEKDLRALRDEMKIKAHLAQMDLKQEWDKLEPMLNHALTDATKVSGEMAADLKNRVAEFKRRLQRH